MLKTLSLYLASAIGLMRMFQKAGYFDKKLAFVPILNEYLVFRLAGVQKEFLLYLVSSLVSWLLHFNRSLILAAAGAGIFALILRIYMAYELAKHYGTGKLMAAGIVCFPALAYLILGYGKQQNGGTGKMKNEVKENTQKKENIEYKAQIRKVCPMCEREVILCLTRQQTKELEEYQRYGGLIQDRMPSLDRFGREFLKTGYCPECQEMLFHTECENSVAYIINGVVK